MDSSGTTATNERPKRRRALRALAWGVGGLVGLLVLAVVVALAFVDSDALAERVRTTWLPELSEQLGRDVTVRDVDIDLLPRPVVALRGLRVEGTGETPLLEAKRASTRLAWWPLLRSFGQEIEVEDVSLDGVDLRLVRLEDGTWAFQELLERAGQLESSGREYVVESIALRNGSLHLVDRSAPGGTAKLAATRIDFTAKNVGAGRSVEAEFRAALGGDSHNLEGRIELDPLPSSFADLEPRQWPDLRGSLSLSAVPVDRLEPYFPPALAAIVSGGQVNLDASIATRDGRWVFTGDSSGQWLLRGEPAEVSFSLNASAPKGRPGALVASVDQVTLQVPGIDAGGSLKLDAAKRLATFDFGGPLLDVGTLLAVMPEGEESPAPEEQAPLLSPGARRTLSSIRAEGRIHFDRLSAGRISAKDVKGRAVLAGGELLVEQAQGEVYGGTLDASGSRADLSEADPDWRLVAKLGSVDLADALEQSGSAAGLRGIFEGSLDLRGTGVDWEQLSEVLSGTAAVKLEDAALSGDDLSSQILGGLRARIDTLGLTGLAGEFPVVKGKGTSLGDIATRVVVQDGWMNIQSPISFETPFGTARLTGRIGLDRRLELTGTALVSPTFVSSITQGRVKPRSSVEVPFDVGGSLEAPSVTGLDADAFVATLARQELTPRLKEQIEKGLGKDVTDKLPPFPGF